MLLEKWEINETIELEGQALELIGTGVRSMLFLKPYILAFYATQEYDDYDNVLEAELPKNMQLIVNSDMISSGMIVMGLKDGLKNTKYGLIPELQSIFDEMFAQFEKLTIKKGDRVNMFSGKNGDLQVFLNNELKFSDSNIDVTKAIFGIWFSKDFDKKFRSGLLGK